MKKLLYLIAAILLSVSAKTQTIKAHSSNSEGKHPKLQWFWVFSPSDSVMFDVYRANSETEKFSIISTTRYAITANDTTRFVIYDTTLVKPGLYKYYISVPLDNDTLLSEIMYGQTRGFLPTPYVESFTANPVKDKKAIFLEWSLNDIRTVKGLAIFRSRSFDDGYELVAQLPADASNHVDTVSRSNEPYFYFLQIRDFFGYQPPSVRIHGFSTFAEKPLPPQDLSVQMKKERATLNFRKVGDNIIGFKVYRKVGIRVPFVSVLYSEVTMEDWYEVVDTVPYPENSDGLLYYVTAVSDGYIESNTSDTVIVGLIKHKKVPPPDALEIIFDDERHPLLIWTVDDKNTLVAGYNVYRSKVGDNAPAVKLNETPLHFFENHYTDNSNNLEGEYLYEVEALNSAGTPSDLKTGLSIEIEHPVPELILVLSQDEKGINISWKELTQKSIAKLNLYRITEKGEPKLMATKPNEDGTWKDTSTQMGNSYSYFMEAVTNNGSKIIVNNGVIITRE